MPTPWLSLPIWASSALISVALLSGMASAETEVEPGPLARGAEIFSREWVPNDPRSRGGDGLGPVYNETSCMSCHGLGSPGGAGPVNKNAVILSLSGSMAQSPRADRNGPSSVTLSFHPGFRKARSFVLHRFGVESDYADWLRVLTDETEAESLARRREGRGTLPPSSSVEEIIAAYVRKSPALARNFVAKKGTAQHELLTSERNTPALFGAVQLDAVPEKVLIEIAEHQPQAIQGRVSKLGQDRVGRFGWKAQTATLREFVLAACAGELGLEVPGHHQSESPLSPDARPKGLDLTQSDCDALIAYVRTLPPPIELHPSNSQSSQLIDAGQTLFTKVGCAGCHIPNLGDLKGVYSDLLLHQMGHSLQDSGSSYGGGPPSQDGTSPGEWRTPPLWGFRDSAPYLHDGRAQTLNEAVAHHGGQAAESARAYFEHSASSRLRIQSFLKTLVAPPADPISTVLYASDSDSRESQRMRAETHQKLLDETLAEQRRVAAENLADARRVAEESRNEITLEKQRLRDAEKNEKRPHSGVPRARSAPLATLSVPARSRRHSNLTARSSRTSDRPSKAAPPPNGSRRSPNDRIVRAAPLLIRRVPRSDAPGR